MCLPFDWNSQRWLISLLRSSFNKQTLYSNFSKPITIPKFWFRKRDSSKGLHHLVAEDTGDLFYPRSTRGYERLEDNVHPFNHTQKIMINRRWPKHRMNRIDVKQIIKGNKACMIRKNFWNKAFRCWKIWDKPVCSYYEM